jgi:hypothetical protein
MSYRTWGCVAAVSLGLLVVAQRPCEAAKLTVELGQVKDIKRVGAIARWDQDGNFKKEVDPKAKIDAPPAEYWANDAGGGKWEFKDLPKGRYDLVIMGQDKLRVEGFEYGPVLEFDPFIPGDAKVADDEDREWILNDIKKSQHYENKVMPLLAGQGKKKVIRVLVMLIRDKETSYEADMPGAATMRHEVWQYDWNYGGWQKNKRTRVLDRVILPRDDLRKWTWLWEGKLGGIKVEKTPITIKYDLAEALKAKKLQGLYPY